MPRLVTVVDEFAELLLAGGRKQRDEFEQRFIRIAAVGRAAGIHLILATQRPSRQAVSGNLKANLQGKIALRVASRTDSGILIDQSGAENLLGNGDLLLAGLSSDPVRLQSAWLSEEERQRIFLGANTRRS
jgi:S-DNA-T family DNA segregation ATPase FtsK/SpoIIIE